MGVCVPVSPLIPRLNIFCIQKGKVLQPIKRAGVHDIYHLQSGHHTAERLWCRLMLKYNFVLCDTYSLIYYVLDRINSKYMRYTIMILVVLAAHKERVCGAYLNFLPNVQCVRFTNCSLVVDLSSKICCCGLPQLRGTLLY